MTLAAHGLHPGHHASQPKLDAPTISEKHVGGMATSKDVIPPAANHVDRIPWDSGYAA